MAERGQPRALDDDKRKTVCSLLAAGVSMRQAAYFVDCDPKTVRREAERNDDFRHQLAKAKSEAGIHPLQTLRQAAKSDWRAALRWMERLEPSRFAKNNPTIITQREANQFAVDLVTSIERAVSEPEERKILYELLSAAMPAAMRRRWEGHGRRRGLADVMQDVDARKNAAQERRAKRRREFLMQIVSYLPWELIPLVGEYEDAIDTPKTPDEADGDSPLPQDATECAPNDDDAHDSTAASRAPDGLVASATSDPAHSPFSTPHSPFAPSHAPPPDNTVPPPRPYSEPPPAQPLANLEPVNDLSPRNESNPPE